MCDDTALTRDPGRARRRGHCRRVTRNRWRRWRRGRWTPAASPQRRASTPADGSASAWTRSGCLRRDWGAYDTNRASATPIAHSRCVRWSAVARRATEPLPTASHRQVKPPGAVGLPWRTTNLASPVAQRSAPLDPWHPVVQGLDGPVVPWRNTSTRVAAINDYSTRLARASRMRRACARGSARHDESLMIVSSGLATLWVGMTLPSHRV